MGPYLQASLAVLEELLSRMATLVRPLDETCLNWSPLPAGANSIAALVTHTVGATDAWLARVVGETISRDREAEFHVRASAPQLVALIERCQTDTRRRLGLLDGVDAGALRRVRRLGRDEDTEVTVAWCVEHAAIHAGEHWGQVQITAQMYTAGR